MGFAPKSGASGPLPAFIDASADRARASRPALPLSQGESRAKRGRGSIGPPLCVAVDLGAGSGRVFLGGISEAEFLLQEVHRFRYSPINESGHLRWNAAQIFNAVKTGLREAADRARQLDRPVLSIGVDSWGTEYGLIDVEGSPC